jgi:hypothetical protein
MTRFCLYGGSREGRSGSGLERSNCRSATQIECQSSFRDAIARPRPSDFVRKAAVHRLETRLDLEARITPRWPEQVRLIPLSRSSDRAGSPSELRATAGRKPRRSPRGWPSRVPVTAGTRPGNYSGNPVIHTTVRLKWASGLSFGTRLCFRSPGTDRPRIFGSADAFGREVRPGNPRVRPRQRSSLTDHTGREHDSSANRAIPPSPEGTRNPIEGRVSELARDVASATSSRVFRWPRIHLECRTLTGSKNDGFAGTRKRNLLREIEVPTSRNWHVAANQVSTRDPMADPLGAVS